MLDTKSKEIETESRLSLFEGIIIGIYGNWLISLIGFLSFEAGKIIAEAILVIISIICLVALLAIGVFGGKLESRIEVLILTTGHFVPLCISLVIERILVKDIFFLFIGGILFSMIYYTEFMRAKRFKRTKSEIKRPSNNS